MILGLLGRLCAGRAGTLPWMLALALVSMPGGTGRAEDRNAAPGEGIPPFLAESGARAPIRMKIPPRIRLTPEEIGRARERKPPVGPVPDHFDETLQLAPQTYRPGAPPAITDPAPVAGEQMVGAEALAGFSYQPHLARQFSGVDETWGSTAYPPDPHIAVGPDHVVVVVNLLIRAYTKDGRPAGIENPLDPGHSVDGLSLYDFFALTPRPDLLSDPKIVFDEASQRFFVLAIGGTLACTTLDGRTYIAVSKTSDPTIGWWLYAVSNDVDSQWWDYPSLGVSDRAVYLGGNLVPCKASCSGGPTPDAFCRTDADCGSGGTCTGFTGTRLYRSQWVLEKRALTTGTPVPTFKFNDLRDEGGHTVGTVRATLTFGQPAGADAFLLSLNDGNGATPFKATLWGVDLPPAFPTDPPSLTVHSVNLPAPAGPLVNGEQRGGVGLIRTNTFGSAAFEAVYQNGRVWTCSHFSAGAAPERDLLRYFELDVSGWPSVALGSTGTLWDGTSFYYWPEIAANHHGDIAMVFSRSRSGSGGDPGEYPGSRWTVRPRDESSLTGSQWLAPGEHYYGDAATDEAGVCTDGTCTAGAIGEACTVDVQCTPTYRWGDYAGAAVDPVDHGFWLFHEYSVGDLSDPNRGRWSTKVGYVPRAVFVDGSYVGVETGSASRPFDTVGEGHSDALGGNDLVIRAGSYPEAVTLDKPVTIIPDGGAVTIGQ